MSHKWKFKERKRGDNLLTWKAPKEVTSRKRDTSSLLHPKVNIET